MSAAKGIEFDIMGLLIIGVVGIIILVFFVSGPLQTFMKGVFCYFYVNILQQQTSSCPTIASGTQFTTISANSVDELATNIAAYAIRCWKDEMPVVTKQFTCFNLNIDKHPGPVYEYNVTKIMETQGGCSVLQNSMIVNENGTLVPYPGNCGSADDIQWNVSGNAIATQQLVLIIYDATIDKIIIQA